MIWDACSLSSTVAKSTPKWKVQRFGAQLVLLLLGKWEITNGAGVTKTAFEMDLFLVALIIWHLLDLLVPAVLTINTVTYLPCVYFSPSRTLPRVLYFGMQTYTDSKRWKMENKLGSDDVGVSVIKDFGTGMPQHNVY